MAFDALLRKYFPVVVGAFIALAAYFQAAGATRLFGAALYGTPPKARAAAASVPTGTVPAREQRSAQAIIDRNPFDSVTGPLHPELKPVIPEPQEVADTSDPLAASIRPV